MYGGINMLMRLDKYLSEAGAASRRDCKQMIREGRVTVDGVVIRVPEQKIDPSSKIVADGMEATLSGAILLMLNKPAGYLTAVEDAEWKTVMELLPEQYAHAGLKPIGRLDAETEGLLLFTNDGDLAHRILAPKRKIWKTYYAEHTGKASEADVQAFTEGLTLKDGTECLPAELKILAEGKAEIRVCEGKYHQVRRMMASRHLKVTYLRRTAVGSATLGDLPLGQTRPMQPEEIAEGLAFTT